MGVVDKGIIRALSDGQQLNSRWIKNRLEREGIRVSTQYVRHRCEDMTSEGKLIKDDTGRLIEYRLVA